MLFRSAAFMHPASLRSSSLVNPKWSWKYQDAPPRKVASGEGISPHLCPAPKTQKMKSAQKLILKRWRSSGHSTQTRVLEPSSPSLVDSLFPGNGLGCSYPIFFLFPEGVKNKTIHNGSTPKKCEKSGFLSPKRRWKNFSPPTETSKKDL